MGTWTESCTFWWNQDQKINRDHSINPANFLIFLFLGLFKIFFLLVKFTFLRKATERTWKPQVSRWSILIRDAVLWPPQKMRAEDTSQVTWEVIMHSPNYTEAEFLSSHCSERSAAPGLTCNNLGWTQQNFGVFFLSTCDSGIPWGIGKFQTPVVS